MDFASSYILTEKAVRKADSREEFAFDTNVVSIKFSTLVKQLPSYEVTDLIKCTNCDAIRSHLSQVSSVNPLTDKQTWPCDFCKFENQVKLNNEKIEPEEVAYLLEGRDEVVIDEDDTKYLIYCIDISGSMNITTKVDANNNKFVKSKFISRLEAVQFAIEKNLSELEKTSPSKRVGLVAFNQSVKVIGDGKINEFNFERESLDDRDVIESNAKRTPDFCSIKETKKTLSEKMFKLEEGGATALGPALFYSILVASKKPGSQVILCTDGMANKGIGSKDDEALKDFCDEMSTLALANGVSVSLIAIENTSCGLGLLGSIADKTMGTVNVVNPLKLREQFSKIIDDQIVATNVVATLILHKCLYVRDSEVLNTRESFVVREIGNVTKETELTFEFGLREDADIDTKIVNKLPFQLKISYTSRDGSKILRVLTQMRPTTADRKTAEDCSDRTILASHMAQSRSRLIQSNKQSERTEKMVSYIKQM